MPDEATESPMQALWAKAEAAAAAATGETPPPADPKAKSNDVAAAAETVATPAAPAPAAPKGDTKAESKPETEAPKNEKRAQLEALAKELGYSLDANAVTVNERVKWRDEKRKEKAAIAAERQKVDQYKAEADKALTERFGRAAQAIEAFDKGDFDGVAAALAGEKLGWKELQGKALQRLQSPEHRRIRELEEKEAQREREAHEAKQASEQQAAQAARAQAEQQYRTSLTAEMGASERQEIKALSKLPMFVSAIMEIQGEAYRRGDELPTPEQALSMPYGGSPLIDNARALWQSLNEAFGTPAPSTQEAASAAGNRSAEDSARTGKKPKNVPRTGATEVSEQKKGFDKAYWANQLRNAD
jgi:hypothetical protein